MSLKQISIKQLTLLGFIFTVLPLIIVLVFISIQVRSIATSAELGIINTTANIENYQTLKANQQQLERSISQYLLVRSQPLHLAYQTQSKQLLTTSVMVSQQTNDKLIHQLISGYQEKLNLLLTTTVKQLLARQQTTSLKPIQQAFDQLTETLLALEQRNNQLIRNNISAIENAAQQTKHIAFQSLWVIPVSLIIAWLFIYLITQPLQSLNQEISLLHQHQLQKPITASGSKEVKSVAQSLDAMRIRLRALERQKSSFIRHMSHELKTPLAAIREGVELLHDHSLGSLNTQQQEVVSIIKSSTRKLQQHIEELLDFNIVLDSTSLQDTEQIDVTSVIEQVIEQRKLDIKRKQLALKLSLVQATVTGNPKHLNVIIDNILSNALKFAPASSVITINSQLNGDQLQLSISDQGRGIAASEQEKVFQPFYQGAPSQEISKLTPKGSGLGLTIVSELVQRLNGIITIESLPKRKCGLQVNITLPRAKVKLGDDHDS